VGAGHRHPAAARHKRVAGRVREISGHSAISRASFRHDPRRVPDDLLVGVDASASGPADRRGVSPAVSLVSLARHAGTIVTSAAVVHFRARGAARRRRLVDGGVRAGRARRGLAISAGDASYPRMRYLCHAARDGAAAE
jgi:hypothetical protein